MVMPMVRLSIPIFRGKYRAMEREAELLRESVGYRRENMINELSVRLQRFSGTSPTQRGPCSFTGIRLPLPNKP
jgi:hypothetical protein